MSYISRLQSIIQTKLALRSTGTTVGLGGFATSPSSGSFASNSGTLGDVTNLLVTITTSGRPVWVGLMSDGTNSARIGVFNNSAATSVNGSLAILNGSTVISPTNLQASGASAAMALTIPGSAIWMLDTPAAGTYSYKLQASVVSPATLNVLNCVLVAYEI